MKKYIEREALFKRINTGMNIIEAMQAIADCPTANVVEEENILKFYYVRSIDEYWIGQRIDNFYYAEYDFKSRQWVWTHSRYLPWGEHVVSPTSLWKEHTYPSEPEEIPFAEWLQGFIKKHAADVRENVHGEWVLKTAPHPCGESCWRECSNCGEEPLRNRWNGSEYLSDFCPNCGAQMEEATE